MQDNPYQPPRFDELPKIGPDSRPGPDAGATGLSEDEIRAFVGKNADYYLDRWPAKGEQYARARGFNWAAFLLSAFWMPYRKMYRVTWLMFGMVAAYSVIGEFAIARGVATEKSLEPVSRVVSIGFSIFCGAFANGWYLAHAQREAARIRLLGLEGDSYHRALARRGGTSLLASLGTFCLFGIAIIAVIVVTQFILYGA
jgi:Protein of unknown function (DUF2628)